jgi:polar amino acid transport system substrate-binding protein
MSRGGAERREPEGMRERRDGRGIALKAIVSACFALLSACGGGEGDLGPEPLVVGMELAYPPFEMRNSSNQPDGISVRMAEGLAEYLGRPLRIEDVQWDGIIPALKSGKIDLIISSMTRTEERAQAIDFSDGYVTNGLCMLVQKDSPIESVDDLAKHGATVATKLATTGDTYAKAHLVGTGVKLTTLDDAAMCALEVVQGKADVFIYDQISIYRHWQNHPDTTRAILEPIREETWAVGIRKGEEALREQVNAFLKQFREAGKFEELAGQYMADEKKAFEAAGVPFIFH